MILPPWALALAVELGELGVKALREWLASQARPLEQDPMRSCGVGDLVIVLGVVGKRTVGRVTAVHSVDVCDVRLVDHPIEVAGLVRGREVNGWLPC